MILTGSKSVGERLARRDGREVSGSVGHLHAQRLQRERVQMSNGLVVLVAENHSTPSISIQAAVNAGSRYETDEKAGLAALTAELISEGTRSRSSEEIAGAIENVGGRLSTSSEYETADVSVSLLSEDAFLSLEIIADVLINPIFPEAKVDQHVARRVAQIRSRLDVPRVLASDAFNELAFEGHPRHRPSVGYQGTVEKLGRADMLDFYRRFYAPNNVLLSVAGDISTGEVLKRIEELFGEWPSSPEVRLPIPPPPVRNREPRHKFIHAEKEQVNIFMGHIGIDRRNPDYYPLRVMDTILGSSPGFTSRIPRILRDEQGLAYSTYANITASAGLDPGRFVAFIGTAPDNLGAALDGLHREIERMSLEPVTEHELRGAKSYLTGSFVFEFQTNSQIAEFLIESEQYDLGADYLERYPRLIERTTVEDVSRVAKEYLDPHSLITVIVGPVDESIGSRNPA